jgi:DNA ligase-3
MLSDLEQGDVAETVTTFFLESKKVSPADKACLTVLEVDSFLDRLTTMTLEDDQVRYLVIKN